MSDALAIGAAADEIPRLQIVYRDDDTVKAVELVPGRADELAEDGAVAAMAADTRMEPGCEVVSAGIDDMLRTTKSVAWSVASFSNPYIRALHGFIDDEGHLVLHRDHAPRVNLSVELLDPARPPQPSNGYEVDAMRTFRDVVMRRANTLAKVEARLDAKYVCDFEVLAGTILDHMMKMPTSAVQNPSGAAPHADRTLFPFPYPDGTSGPLTPGHWPMIAIAVMDPLGEFAAIEPDPFERITTAVSELTDALLETARIRPELAMCALMQAAATAAISADPNASDARLMETTTVEMRAVVAQVLRDRPGGRDPLVSP